MTTSLYDALAERELTIRSINDAFRRSFSYTELYLSPDINKMRHQTKDEILSFIRSYRHFNQFTDPDRLHNRGRFQYKGMDIIWEIHCFNRDLTDSSPDPADLQQTARYMMCMMSHESWESLPPPQLSL